MLLKQSPKSAAALITDMPGYFLYGFRRCLTFFLGRLDTDHLQVLNGSMSGGVFEPPLEVTGTQTDMACHLIYISSRPVMPEERQPCAARNVIFTSASL